MDDISVLRERAKELRCLYDVEAALESRSATVSEAFLAVAELLPRGWRWPDRSGARVVYMGRPFQAKGFDPQAACRSQPIRVADVVVGVVEVAVRAPHGESAFLEEEVTLLARVGARLGQYVEKRHGEMLGFSLRPQTMHWSWRQDYAEAIAQHLDMARFGVEAIYLGGSTEAGTAGSASDIDLYLLPDTSPRGREELDAWLQGWSLALAEMAHRATGVEFKGGLLNVSWLSVKPGSGRVDLRCLRLRGESP